MENVICEQGAQKFGKGSMSREHKKLGNQMEQVTREIIKEQEEKIKMSREQREQ